jgi:periplasmic divalent cation tolerance protein
MEYRVAWITCGSMEEATRIGRTLVEARLAACVNIVPGMRSLYWWEGAVEVSDEVILVAKTTLARADELVAMVRAEHGYQVPCVLLLPVDGGNPAFLDWISRQVEPMEESSAADCA